MAPALVWIDLEMTGLDPEVDVVLQAALALTDLAAGEEPQVHDFVVAQPAEALEGMSGFVREMHSRTGLLQRVATAGQPIEQVEERMLEVIRARCGEKEGHLAGNSVWVDRTFLRRHLPRLEAYLHYRQVDVSSFKLMARSWYGERGTFAKTQAHEAAGDIGESIAELRFYRELFKT